MVGNHTYSISGTYLDTLMSATGCDSFVNTILNVFPPIDTSTYLVGSSIVANASAVQYQWLNCNNGMSAILGENGQIFQPNVTGSYAVALDSGGCLDTSNCTVMIVIGVHSMCNAMIHGFPNPTAGFFTVDFGSVVSTSFIRIVDVHGRELAYRQFFNESLAVLDLRALSIGMYIVEVETEDGIAFLHVSKQ